MLAGAASRLQQKGGSKKDQDASGASLTKAVGLQKHRLPKLVVRLARAAFLQWVRNEINARKEWKGRNWMGVKRASVDGMRIRCCTLRRSYGAKPAIYTKTSPEIAS